MKFLLLNQTFYPDVASTAQHLSDLALALVERGHQVTVISSRRAYDDPAKVFPKQETWRGIRILRVGSTGFGKEAKWRRALDFASFMFTCGLRVALLGCHDAVVALTSPPLISFLGACYAAVHRSRFFYWVMDFNPDEAIAAGWLKEHSLPARVFGSMSRFSLRHADRIIALDRFMRDRILANGIGSDKIAVIPPWSHDEHAFYDAPGRKSFRKTHALDGKFVVMYSGNHSPCHPLDTLLAAARQLASDPGIVFCFVGGGSEFRKIEAEFKQQRAPGGKQGAETPLHQEMAHIPTSGSASRASGPPHPAAPLFSPRLPMRILCLPYQPLDRLAASLSAADLHVVVMGDGFVGTIHPCKIYNILSVGAPVLYIGPQPSHLSDILQAANGTYPLARAGHGKVDQVVQAIQRLRAETEGIPRDQPGLMSSRFSKETLLPRVVAELEGTQGRQL